MQTKNRVILVGRVGADPTTKEVSPGKNVTTFSLATEETWKDDKGEKKSVTEWSDIEMWNNPNVVPYIKKGAGLWIEGKLRTSEYEKSVEGEAVKMKRTKIVVDEIGLLDGNIDH